MNTMQFLMERLENAGVRHVFAVGGDFALEQIKMLWDNPKIKGVNCTDEAHAGFAADGYARVNGVGCVFVTYSVGASKLINAVQCAYAERSPLIVISGAPGMNERKAGYLQHHMVGPFNSQLEMFDKITCAKVLLDNPATAGYEIDRAFEAMRHFKRPIYIELPRDVAKQTVSYDVYQQGTPTAPGTVEDVLQEALRETTDWLGASSRPAILAGVEAARYKLSEQLVRFAERHNIPVATTLLSKSLINERSPVFAGVYFGASSQPHTQRVVEEADCLLVFGDYHHDMVLCFRPARFKKQQVVWANVESLRIKNHTFTDVGFEDFCKHLFRSELGRRWTPDLPPVKDRVAFVPRAGEKVTSERLFAKINSVLAKEHAICADIGDALLGAMDLTVHHSHHFLSPAFYATMGASIPYALGIQMAHPNVRPIVLVGDGAFQMVGTELSTHLMFGCNPIVFVLNNDGYTTERLLVDGKFNDLRRWNYDKVVDLIGGGKGRLVTTEDELEASVKEALDSKELFVINVVLGRKDISQGLRRMAEVLGKRF